MPLCSCVPSIRSFIKNRLACILLCNLGRTTSSCSAQLELPRKSDMISQQARVSLHFSERRSSKLHSPFYHWVLQYILLNFIEEWKELCLILWYSMLSLSSFLESTVPQQLFLSPKTSSIFPFQYELIDLNIAHLLFIPTLCLIKQTASDFK